MADNVSQATRSRTMAAVKSKDTTPELVVRRLVHAMGFRYRLHVGSLPGCPDMVFPRLRKIIIVNGCFWHMHTCGRCRIPTSRRSYWLKKLRGNALRDKQTSRALRQAGWRVLIVWECQTNAKQLSRLDARILKFLCEQTNARQRANEC